MIEKADGSINECQCRCDGEQCASNGATPHGPNACDHHGWGQYNGCPLDTILKVVLVVGVDGLNATKKAGKGCGNSHHLLETSFANILLDGADISCYRLRKHVEPER